MNDKTQWRDEILNSLDDIQRAIPDEILLSQIMARLPENTLTMNLPRWQLRWAAMAACLLVVANLYVLISADKELIPATTTTIALSTPETETEMLALFNDYSLYQ